MDLNITYDSNERSWDLHSGRKYCMYVLKGRFHIAVLRLPVSLRTCRIYKRLRIWT